MTNQIATTQPSYGVAFQTKDGLAALRQTAIMFSLSAFVKANELKGGSEFAINNAMILAAMAQDYGMPVYSIFNSVYFVHGVPSFSAQFFISRFNLTGKFSRIQYDISGKGDDMGCIASCVELSTKERLAGSRVTLRMARENNWSQIWYKLPEQMLRYRAATFLIRSIAPEVLLGMHTVDEERDIVASRSSGTATSVDEYKEEDAIEVPTTPPPSIEEQFRQLCIFGGYECEAIIAFTLNAFKAKGVTNKSAEDCMQLFLAQPSLLERAQKHIEEQKKKESQQISPSPQAQATATPVAVTSSKEAPESPDKGASIKKEKKPAVKKEEKLAPPQKLEDFEGYLKSGRKIVLSVAREEGDPYTTSIQAHISMEEKGFNAIIYSERWNNNKEVWDISECFKSLSDTLSYLKEREWKHLPEDTKEPVL